MHKSLEKITVYLFTLLIIIIFISYWKVQQDDSYIFYNYAKNIALGNGYVFNIGEKVNATTSPLYPLVLALLYFIAKNFTSVTLPFLGHLIGAISLWLICFFSMRVLKKENYPNTYCIYPFIFLSIPLLRNAVGMETFLTLALIIITIYYYQKENYEITAFFSALAILSRYDSVIIVSILFLDDLISKKKLIQLKSILIFVITLLPWFIFSYFYFDSLIPSSITVKLSQQQTNFWGHGLIFFKGIISAFPGGQIVAIIFISAFIILFVINLLLNKKFFKRRITLLILIWTLLYFAIYSFIINPPGYTWYYTIFAILFSLIFILSIEDYLVKKIYFISKAKLIIFTMIIFFIISLILPFKTYNMPFTSKYQNYKSVAEWLNSNVQNGSSVAIDEIGIVGFYYKKGKIIDILGLINPDVIKHLNQNKYYEIINEYHPSYVVTDYPKPPVYESFIFQNIFKQEYALAKIIREGKRKVSIYKRISN